MKFYLKKIPFILKSNFNIIKKTKMQCQKGFENSNMFSTCKSILKTDGVKGLYRGCVPPLYGSGMYRSIQFSAFEAT